MGVRDETSGAEPVAEGRPAAAAGTAGGRSDRAVEDPLRPPPSRRYDAHVEARVARLGGRLRSTDLARLVVAAQRIDERAGELADGAGLLEGDLRSALDAACVGVVLDGCVRRCGRLRRSD